MEKIFDTLEEAWKFLAEHPGSKCKWVASIAKWVVTVAAAYIIYVSLTD
ncbi:MAG: hypothetical protein J6T96_07955 [Bacteroidales bacterium]|nr:hypothetical protein [Bacteroidales bacterium]